MSRTLVLTNTWHGELRGLLHSLSGFPWLAGHIALTEPSENCSLTSITSLCSTGSRATRTMKNTWLSDVNASWCWAEPRWASVAHRWQLFKRHLRNCPELWQQLLYHSSSLIHAGRTYRTSLPCGKFPQHRRRSRSGKSHQLWETEETCSKAGWKEVFPSTCQVSLSRLAMGPKPYLLSDPDLLSLHHNDVPDLDQPILNHGTSKQPSPGAELR